MNVKNIIESFDDIIEQKRKKGQWTDLIELEKRLFNLTNNFTIYDWKIIRNEQYWKTIDSFSYNLTVADESQLEILYYYKKCYTLKCVKEYLKNRKLAK